MCRPGEDVVWPHTEFDADNKRVALWLSKKEEVKKFQNAVKESRLNAWRTAGPAHLALRTILCTKLAHLESFLSDSPQLLCTRCLLYTSPSPRDGLLPRMPSSA